MLTHLRVAAGSRIALVLLLLLAAVVLRWEGRAWWCVCGQAWPWISDAWSSHTSQHLLDPYSLTHVVHGVLFAGLLSWWFGAARPDWQLTAAVAAEVVWEIAENSTLVIERYRTATAALGYSGDTVLNSLGDILCCALGFLLARRLGWRGSALLVVAVELLLLVWIRDNLLLNVLMLLCPLDAVRHWQLGV